MLYSDKPISTNVEVERLRWKPIEDREIGKVGFLVLIVALPILIFILKLNIFLSIAIVLVLGIFARLVMTDAHNKAFNKYWSHWLNQEKNHKNKDTK